MKKWRKWLAVGFLAVMLGLEARAGETVQAGTNGYDRRGTVAEEEFWNSDAEFPSGGAAQSKKAWEKINGVCYNGSGKKITGAIIRGIDVSEWQGTIDWTKVKKSNVDFAFVRISYGVGRIDLNYDSNMNGANKAGVPVGTYVYSTATTSEQALKEAQLAITKMKGYKISYPVVYDMEYSEMGKLSAKDIAQLAIVFCNEVRSAGYYPMVYTNTNWYDNYVDMSSLSGLDVWLARYGDTIDAPSKSSYNYTIWQATDGDGGGVLNSTKGLIDGIPSGNNVDVNFGYVDYTKIIQPRTAPLSTYVPTPTTLKNGWVVENGKTFYYVNGAKISGWKKIDGKYYYFNKTKGLYKSQLVTTPSKQICYLDKNGARVTKRWVTWNNKRYYMDANGWAMKGVHKINGKYYYFNNTTAVLYKNKKAVNKAGDIYYFGKYGTRFANRFMTLKEKGKSNRYYFGSNGKAYKGWHKIDGKWYYFHKKTGIAYRNCRVKNSSGKVYIFDSKGVCTNKK